MTILKNFTKHTPLIIKTLIIVFIILILPKIVINAMEYFRPEKIFIDGIEITAPKGTRLYSASVDRDEIQKPYSSLLFQNTYHFPLPELSESMFSFQAISRDAKTRVLNLHISIDTNAITDSEAEDNFKKYILNHKKKKKYKEYREIDKKECLGFIEKNDNEPNVGYIFHRKKHVTISALSYNNDEIEKILNQFCMDVAREK